MTPAHVVLLGPQFHQPTLGAVVREVAPSGPIATITAGWQEWEDEDAGLRRALDGRAVPLKLYECAEHVWNADPELRDAHREMQHDLRTLRLLYERRLEAAGAIWIELLEEEGPERILGPERDAALEAIQELDARHLRRIAEIRDDFEERMRPAERASVAVCREEIAREISSAGTVVIEGGHAAVLHNRMALFGVPELLGGKVVIGCAAGAMVLCEQVVLYNDSPAIGRGHAEVGLGGFGFAPGVVAFPDASRRLRLDDPRRLRRLALRFAPAACALLDPGARLDWDGVRWTGSASLRVEASGTLEQWEGAA